MNEVNSETYWNVRFIENWDLCDGPAQSRFFAKLAAENFPLWFWEEIRNGKLTLADWGCAEGDGIEFLSKYWNFENVVGIDFSKSAIEIATARYPNIKFSTENWLDKDFGENNVYDIIFSSNTLEHFHKPFEVLEILSHHASKAIALALPYREINRIGEHFSSFIPKNIPNRLSNGFRLTWSKVIDCKKFEKTLWSGDQIFLLYADPEWIDKITTSLADCYICADNWEQTTKSLTDELTERDEQIANFNQTVAGRDRQIANLSQSIAERDGQIANLNQAVVERDGQIANLNQVVVERDGQIANFNQTVAGRDRQIANLSQSMAERDGQISEIQIYRDDKEIYIAMLKSELEKYNQGAVGLFSRSKSNLKKTPYYVKRSVQLIKAKGTAGFINAVSLKLKRRRHGIENNYIQPNISSAKTIENSIEVGCVENPLLRGDLVIIAGVPFDDIGGGQRAAQLARCALKTGRRVVYIYIYKKYDFELNRHIESSVNVYGLRHCHIDSISPRELLNLVSTQATLLVEHPHKAALPYLKQFNMRGMRTVFELIDDWETSLGGDWFDLDVYRHFVADAQCVIGTAKLLVQRLHDLGRNDAIYLPNAANEYIFDKYKTYSRPADLPVGGRRVALYFGSLYGEWFAWDYIKEAARINSDISFVLIGDRPSGKKLPENIYLLGAKLIEELPAYLAHSNFGLLPFLPGKISDAVSPIKVFEYLFSGKPVVSTNLPEIANYTGVKIAHSPEEFAKVCAEITITDSLQQENDRFISQNSWFSRLDEIIAQSARSRFKHVVSVVILIHNNISIIGRCLESLQLHCASYLKEIIVVDNASSDGGFEYVKNNFSSVKILKNPVNGCSSGRNLGAQAASGDYLAFFDSDQWVTSACGFEEALTILDRDANVGGIGWGAGWFDANRNDLGGMISDYCPNRAMNDVAIRVGYRSDIGYLATCGFFIPKAVFDATDGFDLAYDPTCFEDTDMSFQVKRLGLDVCYRDLTGIRHQPHQTTKASSSSGAYVKLFNRNSEYFKKKWINHYNFFIDYEE